jgi:3-dehydroquinate synthase
MATGSLDRWRSPDSHLYRCTCPPARGKSLDSVSALYEAFAASEIEREDVVVALGGGMVGDLAGFAAATYLRGLHWCARRPRCWPWSMRAWAARSASIGRQAKTWSARSIHRWRRLMISIALSTLPDAERRSGMAEVIKAGLIGPGIVRYDRERVE